MKHPIRISLALCLAFSLVLGAVTPAMALPGSPPGLLLWNKLGSPAEVLNSEVGPDIQLTSYKFSDWQEARFEPAKFDSGLFVNHDTDQGGRNDGANFFAVNTTQMALSSERGAIEFWFKFRYGADSWNHAYFFDTRNALMNHYPNQNWTSGLSMSAGWNGWDYGSEGKRFFFYIGSTTQGVNLYTPSYSAGLGGPLGFVDGTLMHFAFVWDNSGIDGGADTLRIYVDGNLAGASTEHWPLGLPIDPYLFIGSGPNCCGWDQHYNAVKGVTDNLVIWDYAKTDFSDRDSEVPAQPPVAEANGPYTVSEGGSVTLDGAGSYDPNPGDILTYAWDLDGDDLYGETGSDAARGDEAGIQPTFSAAGLEGPGSATVSLRVTDQGGLSSTDTAIVDISNVAPVVEAGPDQVVYEDAAVSLAPATFTDAGTQDTHTATVDWGDGTVEPGTIVEAGGSGTVAGTHVYPNPGTYLVTVAVTDDDGGSGTDTMTVKAAHGFLRFCGFAEDDHEGLQVRERAKVVCSLGANGRLDIQKRAAVTGDLVSVRERIDLGDRAAATGDLRAGGDVQLARGATVGSSVTSGAAVTLKLGARVDGNVTAAGRVRLETGATVGGTISEWTPVPPIPPVAEVRLSLSAGGGADISVQRGTRTLAPGSYGKLTVRQGATLVLVAGSYAFEQVSFEKKAVLSAELAGGNLLVDVVRSLEMKEASKVIVTGGSEANVMFRVQGNHVTLGKAGSYLGTYLAPDASIELDEGATLKGALYGHEVNIDALAGVTGQPALAMFVSLFLP